MTFFWSKVYGLLGKTPYIYPRYQVWGVMDLGFDFWRSPLDYHPPLRFKFFKLYYSGLVMGWMEISESTTAISTALRC